MNSPTSIPLRRRLAFRIAQQILAVVLIALAMNAYLNYSNFIKTQKHLVESRILVSSGDVKRAINGLLMLGLSLDEISNLPEILGSSLKSTRSAGVQALLVLDKSGQIVVSTDSETYDWSSVSSWPIERQQNETLRSLAADRFAIGIPLSNALNEQLGWLIVDYDGTNQIATRNAMRSTIFRDFLISAAIAAFLILGGVLLLTRSFVRNLQKVTADDANLTELTQPIRDRQLGSLGSDYQAFIHQSDALLTSGPSDNGQHQD